MLFEIHQPIGHLQVRHVEQIALVAKRRDIFAVRIDHHDVAFGGRFANAMQDQRCRRGFAGAGRSQQCKMLAQKAVDIDAGANILGRMDGADTDRCAPVAGIDLAQIRACGHMRQRARHRIARNAPAKGIDVAGQPFGIAFTHEIDFGDHAAMLFFGPRLPQCAHHAQQPGGADTNLDLTADLARHGDRRIGIAQAFVQAFGIEYDHRRPPRNITHHADRSMRVVAADLLFIQCGVFGPTRLNRAACRSRVCGFEHGVPAHFRHRNLSSAGRYGPTLPSLGSKRLIPR